MRIFVDLINALATVAWPAIAIFLIYKFYPLIKVLLSRDKVSFKFGGMEMSAEQTAQSLASQVEDLQKKVVQLEEKITNDKNSDSNVDLLRLPIRRGEKRRILWVDDVPSNNAIQIQNLTSDGLQVDAAIDTAQAISMFEFTKYDLVITDMGRTEDGVHRPTAGITLAKELRQRNPTIPIIIFTTHRALERFQESAQKAGVNLITNSTIELYRHIPMLLTGK
jgi:CheY-like chemotaxis protein